MNASYQDYLNCKEWKIIRQRILERDKYLCQACGLYDKQYMQVHHLWYENDGEFWRVSDDYLISLCEECHIKLHQLYKNGYKDILGGIFKAHLRIVRTLEADYNAKARELENKYQAKLETLNNNYEADLIWDED